MNRKLGEWKNSQESSGSDPLVHGGLLPESFYASTPAVNATDLHILHTKESADSSCISFPREKNSVSLFLGQVPSELLAKPQKTKKSSSTASPIRPLSNATLGRIVAL